MSDPGRPVRGSIPGALRLPAVGAGGVRGGGGDDDVVVRSAATGQPDLRHDGQIRELPVEVAVEVFVSRYPGCEYKGTNLMSDYILAVSTNAPTFMSDYILAVSTNAPTSCLIISWL